MAIIQTGTMVGARKKAAGFVYQKGADGKTVMRAYVVPNNPQTAGQMAQRIIFATCTMAAKFMNSIISHSFEGIKYGGKSRNHFVSLNIEALRQAAAADFQNQPAPANATMFVSTRSVSALIPNDYVISDGSLSQPRMKVVRREQGAGVTSANALQLSFGGGAFPLVEGSTGMLGVTLAQLVNALFGLNALDEQLSLCAIAKNGDGYRYSFQGSTNAGEQIPYTAFSCKRLVFRPGADLSAVVDLVDAQTYQVLEHAEDNIADAIGDVFNDAKTDVALKDYVVSKISSLISLTATSTDEGWELAWPSVVTTDLANLYVYDAENDSSFLLSAGVIRSKLVGANWRRSRTVMKTTFPTGGGVYNFGLVWSIANAAWFAKADLSESGWFLNEGGSDNEVGENF